MENGQLTASFQPEPVAPKSPSRQHCSTLLVACLSGICIFFTVFFAFNCSLDRPLSQKFTFQKPERSILVLNILSQLSMFLLAELTIGVFDMIRWAQASSESGLPALTFIILSSATSITGVLYLLLASVPGISKLSDAANKGLRVWGSQRYICYTWVG
jgi:hypothetical protein